MSVLNGKVAVVTGAGRGLGREEAIELARQGARVVINDIGIPAAKEAAMEAVEIIKGFGGEAIAVFGDCADSNDAANLMKTTLDTFGDLNIMVNNAGFCRDKTIFSMTDEEFDSVVRVHLRGHFVNMRNATAFWREKAKASGSYYGRLISTSSEAMLFGSAGQPNYAAAKAGITAMTMGAAQLMIKYGITCNVIMPRARTDMTNQGQTAAMFAAPQDGFDAFHPSNVAPLVAYLASPSAGNISGEVFIVWGGRVTIVQRPTIDTHYDNPEGGRWTQEGLQKSLSAYFTPEHVPVWGGFSVPPM